MSAGRSAGLSQPQHVAVQVPETFEGLTVVTPDFISDAHANNRAVHVWTVNDASDMRRLLDWGADGIMTDRPTLLEQVLRERGRRTSPPGQNTRRTSSRM